MLCIQIITHRLQFSKIFPFYCHLILSSVYIRTMLTKCRWILSIHRSILAKIRLGFRHNFRTKSLDCLVSILMFIYFTFRKYVGEYIRILMRAHKEIHKLPNSKNGEQMILYRIALLTASSMLLLVTYIQHFRMCKVFCSS